MRLPGGTVGLALTSGTLAGLHLVSAAPPRLVETSALVGVNLAATVVRFVLMRRWVFSRAAS